MDFPPITTLLAPAFTLSVALEWWAVRRNKISGRYEGRDALASMAMGLGNVVVNALTAPLALGMMMLAWPYRLVDIPVGFWSFAALFVLYDLIYYWKHRCAHRIRWFWMEHVTHHSSTHYNLSTALRQPWFGPLTGLILLGWPLVLMGFHPAFVFFAASLNLVYQFWVHTESIDRLPDWVERLFNTPSHHRVHHATNPIYLDSNYAGVLIVWDKFFSTFVPEQPQHPPVYGIVKPVGSHNPIILAFHELAGLFNDCRRDGWRPQLWLRRMINAPGWCPDGQHNRSEEIKAAWHRDHG